MDLKPIAFIVMLILAVCAVRFLHQYDGIPQEDKHLFQDEVGFPYIQDADSYFYYHNVDQGIRGDGLSWFGFYWHKLMRFINPQVTLMGSLGLVSLFLFGLVVLNVFFIAYLVTKDYLAGFLAGLVLAINPIMFVGTLNFDTNTLNYFFVTAIALCFVLLVQQKVKDRRDYLGFVWFIIYSFIFCILFDMFEFTWSGWYFMLFVLASSLILFLIIKFIGKREWKYVLFIFPFSLIIFLVINYRWPFKGYLSSVIKQEIGFHTISELHKYGVWILLLLDNAVLVIVSILFSLYFVYKRRDAVSCFLMVWLFLMLYSASESFRFSFFAIIPYSIIAGIMLFEIVRVMKEYKDLIAALFVVIFLALLASNDYSAGREYLVDDSIYSLNEVFIPEGAVILNNWDYGYIIQAFTDRTVISLGSPDLKHDIKGYLAWEDESLLEGDFIILSEHDYKVLKYQYYLSGESVISKLLEGRSEAFELYHISSTPYNWVRVWRVTDGAS